MKYNPSKIEHKWQRYWEAKGIYRAHDKSDKPKYYQLETFPYPSGAGLHVGHPKGYIAEDIHARYMRMNANEVMYTMGWDAFGLPTENYAIKVGKSPQEVAIANIKNFKRQVKMFGLSYDWDREINTSSPEYYKWTQWMFIQLYKAGLAYQKSAKVNWCPKDLTVLANEQVVDGKCERCGEVTTQKEMKQWFFKITDYAERLLGDLEGLDWPEATIKKQKDWIGKSEGAKLKFPISDFQFSKFVEVFTTRPDTLFGATFVVIAPELAKKWIDLGWKAGAGIQDYIAKSLNKKELDRLEGIGDKTGVDTGIKAINPATKEEVPVWVADYVLGGYGTGAIMAVPAHDQRDFEFAKKFRLPIKMVICPNYPEPKCPVLDKAYEGYGHLVDSDKFDGMEFEKAKWEITKFVGGEKKTQYKIRDWSVSRQRYWGVPIPIIYCDQCGIVPVPDKDLPIKLPPLKDYRPKGVPPLASSKKFLEVKCPNCKLPAKRDAETLDTFVDSSWYYLRYTDPKNKNKFADDSKLKAWLPVKLYIIGAEHSVLHLLYARFITKVLHDRSCLNFIEPFLKLRHLGLILGTDGQKMSKSKGNVINPDGIVKEFGADSFRMYEMFMGPFEDGQPWDTKGVIGVYRFLGRVWNFISKLEKTKLIADEVEKILNKAIKEIGDDIRDMKFNTGVSGLMKLLNALEDKMLTVKQYETFLKLMAPFAPHLAEELWQNVLKNGKSIHLEKWPEYDEKLLAEEKINLVIQVNGRVRDTIMVKKGLSEEETRKLALASENVKRHIVGEVKKIIYVRDRIINLVV